MEAKISMKAARVNAGYTQADMAQKLEVTRVTYIKWENGEGKPYGDHLMRLINWLNIESVQHLTKYNYDISYFGCSTLRFKQVANQNK